MSHAMMISGSIILIALTAITGVVLSQTGRPLNTILFTIHKLSAVGFTVFSVIIFINLIKTVESVDSTTKFLLITVACAAALLFVTGGLLSFDRFAKKFVVILHAVLTIVISGSAGTVLYLLLRK